MILNEETELRDLLKDTVDTERGQVLDPEAVREKIIDVLVWTAVFSDSPSLRARTKKLIWQIAHNTGTTASSIHHLYMAMGKGLQPAFTVPAMNIRCITYDVARKVFRVANSLQAGAFIFELARSEMGYTDQSPWEYTTCVLAAAVKENYRGHVFIQGDHFQVNPHRDLNSEIASLKSLIRDALDAGFYNIDIDASTMVDYSRRTVSEQQAMNYTLTAQLAAFIREHEPEGVVVSIGAEIGHIGGKNSTVEEAEAFMEGFLREFQRLCPSGPGLSKLSVQTGTTHGGVPLPDGTVAEVKLDFSVLRDIGALVRQRYGLSGTVQHGASTLPEELFDLFPENNCSEIHLATGFQNIMFQYAPEPLREEVYGFLKDRHRDEWKEGMTEEQFLYKTRKKAFGPFKRRWWEMDPEEKTPILDALEERFRLLFKKLRVEGTHQVVNRYVVSPVEQRFSPREDWSPGRESPEGSD